MLENYFFDKHGLDQQPKIQREKAVAAVMEVLLAAAPSSGAEKCLGHIQERVSNAADALQKALEK